VTRWVGYNGAQFVSTKEDSVKVTVDETLCSGCGVCEEMAPDVFEMNDSGVVAVKVNPIPEDLQQSTQEAADGCPSGAILVEA
jgi:ferredoxin